MHNSTTYTGIMARAALCTVVLSFLLMLHSSEAGAGEILVPPESQAVPLGTNATFVCSGRGRTTSWVIDNAPVVFSNRDSFIERGFVFPRPEKDLNEDDETQNINNLTMIVLATIENNNTMIKCSSHVDTSLVSSDVANLTVIGTPSPVQLAVSVLNATTLQVSWDPPFTFPGHEILHYDITVENKTTGETIIDHLRILVAEERVVYVNGEIAQKCDEITFTVTATNDIGESNPTTVSGWLPIAPGPFPSPPEIDVLFESDGTPVAQISFGLPEACPSQELKYTIIIEGRKDDEIVDVFTIGPTTVFYVEGKLVEESTNSKLVPDIDYEIIIAVQTMEGTGPITVSDPNANSTGSRSFKDSFHTGLNPTTVTPATGGQEESKENNDDWPIIPTIAAGCGGILLLLVLTFAVATVICVRRKKVRAKAEIGNSHTPMVANPIYEGDLPVYETIEEAAVNFPYLPTHPHVQECPYHGQPVTPWYENGTSPQMNDRFRTEAMIPSSVMSEDNYTFMNAAGARETKKLSEEEPPRNDTIRYIRSEC